MASKEICNCALLRRASRKVTQMYDNELAAVGLRTTQFAILAEVRRRAGPPVMGELARALVMDRSTLGHNLRPLEREGLIVFQSMEEDRRNKRVALTAAGEQRYRDGMPYWRRAQQRFEAAFGAAWSANFREVTTAISRTDFVRVSLDGEGAPSGTERAGEA